MATLNEVYGTNFQSKSIHDKATYVVKLYATNIIHKQFSFRNEGSAMWDKNNMKPDIIKILLNQVQSNNPKFRLVHIPKSSKDLNMFPYLINGAVEYFIVVDMSGKETSLYSIYITPSQMEAF